jgi:hypothetical protein
MTSSSPKPRKPNSAALQIGLTPEQKERNRKADEARARVRQQRGSAGSGAGGSRSGGRSPGAVTTAPRATPPRTGGRGGAAPRPRTQASATPPAAVQRSNPPPKKKPDLLNDIQYELGNPNSQTRRLGAKVLDGAAEVLYPRKQVIGAIESVRKAEQQKGGGLTPVETIDAAMKGGRSYLVQQLGAGLTTNLANFSRFAYTHAQKVLGQQVDQTAGPIGSFIDSAEEGGYRALGMKPPAEMTQDELGRSQLRSDITGAFLSFALLRKAPMFSGARALQATTTMGRVGYGGVAAAGQEVANSIFSDPTGGNLSNAVNYYAGADVAPFAVDPGKDDWVTSFWKGLPANAVGGELLGSALGLGADAAIRGSGLAGRTLRELGVPMANTRGLTRRARGAAQETAEQERQVAGGLLQRDLESGAHAFTPEVMGRQPQDAPTAEPGAAMPPEADPAFDPWTEFRPELPTSTALGKALDDLTDEQLGLLRDNAGASVPEGVEDLLAAQQQVAPMPPQKAQVLPTSVLPPDFVESLANKYRGFADGERAFDPRPLFDPDTNPDIWKRAQALTGKDDPADLTPTDMADTLEGLLADGQAVIPSRQGAEMMDVAGIRRPVPDAAPVADAGADPWAQPSNAMPDQTRWDPRQEGAIQIQDNPDGTVAVVPGGGAQRLGLAERLGVGQVPVTREALAPDAPDAPVRVELTPEERAKIKRDLLMRAAQAGEIRPPDAPVPAFSDPALQNLGKVDLDKSIEPGSPEAQALADEARIAVEAMREQNEFAQGMKDAQRDAEGYEKLTWAEKMAKGVTGGWEAPPPARAASPAPGVPQAPVKPVQVKLSGGGDQPPFTLPPGLAGAKPRYGSRQVRFGSDLDKVAYMLLADRSKGASKSAAAYRQALEEAGLDVGSVVNHGLAVKKALKASRPAGDGVIDLPQQQWGGGEGYTFRSAPSPGQSETGRRAFRRIATDSYEQVSPEEYAQRVELVSAVVEQVAGKKAKIEFIDVYEREIIPREHGGDGRKKGEMRGMYNFTQDIIQINGMLDADVSALDLATAAFHESFHRLQFLGFGKREMSTLNGSVARLAAVFRQRGMRGTYIEQTPNAFMHYGQDITAGKAFMWYGQSARKGKNPLLSLFGIRDAGELPTVQARRDANFIVSGFVRLLDNVERIANTLRGRGALSTREIYDGSLSGVYGRRADAESERIAGLTTEYYENVQRSADAGHKTSAWALDSAIAKFGELPRLDPQFIDDWRHDLLQRAPNSWAKQSALGGASLNFPQRFKEKGGQQSFNVRLMSDFGDYLKRRREKSLAQIEDIRNNARKGGCL